MAFTGAEQGRVEMRFDSTGALFGRSNSVDEIEVVGAGGGSGGAGIGFDTLSNVLVVDPSFDENTAGWGVTAFDDLLAAINTLVTPNHTIIINGGTHDASGASHSDYSLLAISETRVEGMRISSGTHHVFSGDLTIGVLTVGNDNPMDFRGITIERINCTVIGSHTPLVRFFSCAIEELYGTIYKDSLFCCDIDEIVGTVGVNPLNHTNTLMGVTYRETVLVADLPAASSANQGATAMTSDGGTASAPAMMVNLDGTNWTVAYE